ncbi:COG3 [Candida theae]|uniref:Conserved oligomeric Golgi complex subunit 3 n=1 Tax=Candida theae TaxID=1198502 RepID=A0AAD5BF87_9ASCO|nr:COG3 [Candida theae]KAI5958802.1 COG3 [Candida theae]
MARTRSKSTVSQIASDVHMTKNDSTSLHDKINPNPTTFKRSRSKSESNDRRAFTVQYDFLYPLCQQEKQTVWTQFIESLDFDVVLKTENIEHINAKHLNSMLEFQSNLQMNRDHLNGLISQTDTLIEDVNSCFQQYKRISEKTSDFDAMANELLEKQTLHEQKYNKIHSNLKHFERLDSITKSLSKSGSHLLTNRRSFFINDILRHLDDSLEFMDEHPGYKDCELYKSRFRQCMTRALTLIRNFLGNELRSTDETVSSKLKRNSDESKQVVTIDLLIYNEFNLYLKHSQETFHELARELFKRSVKHDEYNGLINDVLNTYFQIRGKLLKHYIDKTSTINDSYKKQSNIDLVQTCQDQISYFKKIVEKEFVLFSKFFTPSFYEDELKAMIWEEFYAFLKNVLDPLYDIIRLWVLKEVNISSLCQLTTLLQKYYEFEDLDDPSGSVVDSQSYFGIAQQDTTIRYGFLFQPVLDDTQHRLIFRIQNYVDTRLLKYKPSAVDLKIGHKKQSKTKTVNPLDEEYDENLFPDVYLPLAKAMTLLSNIYELIDSAVFDDIAHYIVHACIVLLKGEYSKLITAHLGEVEGRLSYLHNLIILRNQIKNFDIHYTRNDYTIDFTSGISHIWNLLRRRTTEQRQEGFFEIARKTVPRVINNMIDANQEIEVELNTAVSELLTHCSNDICAPVLETTENAISEKSLSQFKDNVVIKIPKLYNDIKSIINDPVVTHFLMNNLSDLILATYEEFLKHAEDLQSQDHKELDLMEMDALSGFIGDTVNQLYEDEQYDKPVFNEEVLENLELNDNEVEGFQPGPASAKTSMNESDLTKVPNPDAEHAEYGDMANKSPSPTSPM